MENIFIDLNNSVGVTQDGIRIADNENVLSQTDALVGPQGPAGPAGKDGQDGQAATITVGSTTTGAAGTNASVTNSGTSSAAVLNFTIPRGDTGATGPQGPAGSFGYMSAPLISSSYLTINTSGTIIQTLDLPAGKWLVYAQFRLSAGGMGANKTAGFYVGFKHGTTMSSTTIQQSPTNISGDAAGSGRVLLSFCSPEITSTGSYVISSYCQNLSIDGTDIKIYKDPGVFLYAFKVG